MKTKLIQFLGIVSLMIIFTGLAFAEDPPAADGFKISQSFTDYIRPIIGANFVVKGTNFVDFKTENDVLLAATDSRFRAGAFAGFFTPVTKCGAWWHKLSLARSEGKTQKDIEAHFNEEALLCDTTYKDQSRVKRFLIRSGITYTLQATQGTEDTVNGFTFGWGFAVRPGVLLTAGYTREKGEKISSGFARAAAAAIADTGQPQFSIFRDLVNANKTGLKSARDWDGLPLKLSDGTAYFPGNPIVKTYNGSLSFGIAVSLDAILK